MPKPRNSGTSGPIQTRSHSEDSTVINLTDKQIEIRLNMLEKLIAKAVPKDLPSLNKTFQRLLDEQVRRDMVSDTPIGKRIAALPQPHSNDNPLWAGPCGDGWNGGVTQSMLARFFSCRERFRLKYVLGLEPPAKWNHKMGYGNMWHVCEEGLAQKGCIKPPEVPYPVGGSDWESMLDDYYRIISNQYPFQREEIHKWYNVCRVQFPEYVKYWSEHPDVLNRVPLLQEQVFDVPYLLPSKRIVRLRGRWDSVDLIDGGIWLQENKTKGDIDKTQIERQLKFDLQTMVYLIALENASNEDAQDSEISYKLGSHPILGVRYNVIRRPLSGGKGSIRPHAAKQTKAKFTPAETEEQFYERLRKDYISAEPDYWFFRVRCEITPTDIEMFRRTCLDPLLENLCDWYADTSGIGERWDKTPTNYRTPFGMYNSLEEDGSTEYDYYLETGSEATLRRTEELFTELK